MLAGWTIENVPIESLDVGGWLRGLSFAALAIAGPIAGAAAMALSIGPPAFARIIGPKPDRVRDPLALTLGVLLMALTVLAVQSALALSFDPRYRDFPFAPLTAAALPFLLLSFVASAAGARPRGNGRGCGAGAVRGLHRLERDARQLAGAVVCRGACPGRVQLASGTGRARLRISSATASADSAVL